MKQQSFLLLILLLLTEAIFSQENFNVEVIANVEIGERGNDIWGFVDDNGLEYAVIGSMTATRIFSLEDITNPIERAVIEGAASTWRDIKHFDDYIYVTCDSGDDGLLIIDMTGAPEYIEHKFWKPEIPLGNGDQTLRQCHNLHIDEKNGWCYLAGCNIGVGGIIILDIHTDPLNPVFVGATNEFYSHDVVARGDTIYSSEINDGHFSIYNVVDKNNPIRYIMQETSSNFSHSAWPSEDGHFLFTCDERPDASLDAYNISDPNDVELIDRYKPLETIDQGLIPHNPHYHNDYIYISWNSDGIVIVDASKPDNLVKVGAYDTFLGNHGGFNGLWGVYPFLPSGYILGSDRDRGLFIFSTTLERACHLEGKVINKLDGSVIVGAEVKIESEQLAIANTNAAGIFKTGLAKAGSYVVKVNKPEFEPAELSVNLENGVVTDVTIEIQPFASFGVVGNVIKNIDGNPIEGAHVLAISDTQEVMASSDENGGFSFLLDDKPHKIYAGAWGYKEKEIIDFNPAFESEITFRLEEGYKDDFILDQGWTVSGDANTGIWERGQPLRTIYFGSLANPDSDSDNDLYGDRSYITGNAGGAATDDDVDNGSSILTSKAMDLSDMDNPKLSFERWFFNEGDTLVNDTLFVLLSDQLNTLEVGSFHDSEPSWIPEIIEINSNNIDLSNVSVSFVISDEETSDHIVEAGIDKFEIVEGVVSNKNFENITAVFSPNPFNDVLTITTNNQDVNKYLITDVNGKVLLQGNTTSLETNINTSDLSSGIYFIQLRGENVNGLAKKIIKM